MQNSEAALAECSELEAEIAGLRAAYEQYFSGVERIAPLKRHEALKKRLTKLKSSFIKQTAVKFRVNSLYAKYLTYERQWAKTMEQRENGTYRPDLERARRRAKQREEQEKRKQGGAAPVRGAVELDPTEDVDLDDFDFSEFDAPSPSAPAPEPVDEFDALLDALSESGPSSPPAAPLPSQHAASSVGAGLPRASAPTEVPKAAPLSSAPAVERPGLSPAAATVGARPGQVVGAGPSAIARPSAAVTGAASGSVGASPSSSTGPVAAPGPRPAVASATAPTPARPVAGSSPALPRATPGAATPQAVRAAGGAVSDQKLQAVYDAYVMAKRRCNEDTSQLSFEKVAGQLRREVGQLTRENGARAVEFKVVIKDGRAELRTIAKD